MKRLIFLVILTVFILGTTFTCLAQTDEEKQGMGMGKGMGGRMMHNMPMGKGMMGGMMQGMPMGNMMGRIMIATSDGGVIVMMLNKLYKYDKDLNLVKEAEIPLDIDHVKKMMMEMKEIRTMGGMKKDSMPTEP